MTEVRPLDPVEIAAKLIHFSWEDREEYIKKLAPYTFTLSDGYKVDRNESVRLWLRDYDDNGPGGTRDYLNKLHGKAN